MSGVILSPLEQPETAASQLAAAACLAELVGGARIEALVVRTPPETTILPSEEVLTSRQIAQVNRRETERLAALRTAFDRWSASADAAVTPAKLCEVEGLIDTTLREWGSRADFIVLRRPGEHHRLLALQEIQTALFETDRPVLIVPYGRWLPFGRRIAIAWRNDRQANRAVLSAMRFRMRPEHVFVLAGVREDAASPTMPEILQEHGVEAEMHLMPIGPGVFGEALLAKAHALGADLLVMGAYRHSPIREIFLGGVTRFMLDHSDLPLLIRH